MFIENGKWNFPLVKILKGEMKATPLAIAKLIVVAVLIKVVAINAFLFVFFPDNFPAPITGRLVGILG